MKMKKLLSLALVMALSMSLTVPAMAAKGGKNKDSQPAVAAVKVDKIEDAEDPRLPMIENGAEINTGKYSAIYIKQANDVAIWVPSGDTRSDADIIAEARASDKSLAKEGKGAITVIRDGENVWLHKNNTTQVVAEAGVLTVLGPISHIGFVGGDAPTKEELGGDGETATILTMLKYVDEAGTAPTEKFGFEVYPAGSDEKITGVEVTVPDEDLSTYTFTFEPKLDAGSYVIREVLTAEQAAKYEAGKTFAFTVDEAGEAVADEVAMINVSKGTLEVTAPTVKQEYIEQIHENVYRVFGTGEKEGTVLSVIDDFDTSSHPIVVGKGTSDHGGFSYLVINKAALAASENGLTVRIGYKDQKVVVPCPEMKETDAVPTYTVKINEEGKLVVTSDLGAFTAKAATTLAKEDFSPKHHFSNETFGPLNLPETETFQLFFHGQTEPKDNGQGVPYETNEVIGCKLVSTETKEKDFECTLTTVVTNAAGEEVDYSEKLTAGTYTVTVTNDKTNDVWTATAEVKPGETTTVEFGEKIVSVMGDPVIKCDFCQEFKAIPLVPAETDTPVEP